MLLLISVFLSLEFPKCISSTYPTACGKLVSGDCTFDQLYADLPTGSLDLIKATTIKTCTTDCLKQHTAAYDCMVKEEDSKVESIAKTCLKVWNNHCNKIDDKLCRIDIYNYWQSKGHNNYTEIKYNINDNINDGYECTDCQKQFVSYAMAFENYQNQFDGPRTFIALGVFNMTMDTCGKTFFDGYGNDVESYQGLKEKNATSDKAPDAKTTQSGSNDGLLINLSLILVVISMV